MAIVRGALRVCQPFVARAAARQVVPASFVAVQQTRGFAAAVGKKPKYEDGTLEGRYATALFMASGSKLQKVYEDVIGLRTMMEESKDFKLLIETPGVDPETKVATLEAVCKKMGAEPAVVNFIKVLVENKRIKMLARVVDLFEVFYRAEKNLVVCKVTSAAPLSSSQQGQVKKAMEQRAEKGAQMIMEFNTNASIMGGLVVKMGDAVFDNSVATRLERIQIQLMHPVE
mmetsp:Transcript_27553/g.41666  ORF Transcript_27553/g.41666 Transcript_27553/m.41666 type:complete len:229 (-) Transcript_27553:180-866(-)|eukprot:CAMPEP_0194755136 /NCGR_PEP_ID=MMETSP0323_2-20130528/9029_1 /TAXON_ID=2866 ORGANISM="Crypthecodinium cohnii, Strain Seligo" /NCGR_SAMPLE_ID=MMETSP0323_2 /ASSEMBLY_ACC=CAM_ASM_000346 /LENGTH=228 /DNA_ID=CAMNT_0039674029 /DNA_START=19 /DNA_END=705 /DNA_ORIENTATION=+